MSIVVQQWCNICQSKPADQAVTVPAGQVLPAGTINLCDGCFARLEATQNA